MQTMPRLCPDQAREIMLDWLTPLTEDGTMDTLFHRFVAELAPFAAVAAQQALRESLSPNPEAILVNVRQFLGRLLDTFETMSLNPDMMAVSHESWAEMVRAMTDLRDWIHFLERRNAPHQEAVVHPTADVILSKGNVP